MHTTWQARPKEKPLFARCICEHGHRYLQRADLRLRQLPLRASHCCAKASAMISSNSCNLLVLKSSVPPTFTPTAFPVSDSGSTDFPS